MNLNFKAIPMNELNRIQRLLTSSKSSMNKVRVEFLKRNIPVPDIDVVIGDLDIMIPEVNNELDRRYEILKVQKRTV